MTSQETFPCLSLHNSLLDGADCLAAVFRLSPRLNLNFLDVLQKTGLTCPAL